MAKSIRKTPGNDAAKSLRETEKRIRAVEKQITKTGRIRNPKTGAFVKATLPNIRKVEKEILRDVKQSKRTLKAASKFVDTIAGFFKEKKKGKGKPSPSKKSTKQQSVSAKGSKPKKPTVKRGGITSPISSTKQSSKKSASKPSKKSPVVKPSRQRIYEVSELPEAFQALTANGTLEAIEDNADNYNALLRPGDVFGGKVGYVNQYGHFVGGYTHKVFATIEDYIQEISHYRLLETSGDDEDKHVEVLDLLKIIRFKAAKKHTGGAKQPTFRQSQFSWTANRSDFNKKKAESKKAYKKKKQDEDKARAKREKNLRVENARLRGENLYYKLDKEMRDKK